uniref:Uncharacterized protein n=1 Tax=Mola mola TaxID=94237 RepID=A0A3Q3XRQ9_MOLML
MQSLFKTRFLDSHTKRFHKSHVQLLNSCMSTQFKAYLLTWAEESPVINWSLELGTRLDSGLYALWNRTAGDCLLDSVLQATWGIYDKDSVLHKTLHESYFDWSDQALNQSPSFPSLCGGPTTSSRTFLWE